jgi:hypothetical protein
MITVRAQARFLSSSKPGAPVNHGPSSAPTATLNILPPRVGSVHRTGRGRGHATPRWLLRLDGRGWGR